MPCQRVTVSIVTYSAKQRHDAQSQGKRMEKSQIHANRYGKGEKRCWQKKACLMIRSQVDVRTRANLDLKVRSSRTTNTGVQTQNVILFGISCCSGWVAVRGGLLFWVGCCLREYCSLGRPQTSTWCADCCQKQEPEMNHDLLVMTAQRSDLHNMTIEATSCAAFSVCHVITVALRT